MAREGNPNVTVRLSPSERRTLEQLAEKWGVSMSAALRRAMLAMWEQEHKK